MKNIRPVLYFIPGLLLVLLGLLMGPLLAAHASSGTWTTTGSMNVARSGQTATLLPNGKVLVAGGDSSGTSAELYDPNSGTWTTTGSMSEARLEHTATLLPNGKVLVAGGDSLSSGTSAELYDPSSGTWTTTGSMSEARFGHTATLLPNGKVLVAGGGSPGSLAFLASAELYDPSSGTWSPTGSMSEARLGQTATLLPNGKVLVAGGLGIISFSSFLASAELYDPSSGTWSPTGSMNVGRVGHTATLLPNGKVLVAGAGGASLSSFLASAELYDPSSGTWSPTSSMSVARTAYTAILLPNGKVLVAGGVGNVGGSNTDLASAELYDPSSGTWTTISSMNVGRGVQSATLLPNGTVLVAGGVGSGGSTILASAELFTLDTTPPVLSLPGTITMDATSPAGAVVTYMVSATDPDDPPSQLTITCTPGSTFAIGTTTVNCSASDPAGNTASGSFQVVVKGVAAQSSDLINTVNGFHLSPGGTQNSFDSQLQAVQADLAANNSAQACSDLASFIAHVNAQSGKHLTPAQANQLVAAAQQIEAVLGC